MPLIKTTELCHCKSLLIAKVLLTQMWDHCEVHSESRLVFVNNKVLCFVDFAYTQVFKYVIHSSCKLYFLHDFNKMYPVWLNTEVHWDTCGRVSWYAPGTPISPSQKRAKRVHFGVYTQSDCFCSVDHLHHRDIPTKTDHDITKASCGDVLMM